MTRKSILFHINNIISYDKSIMVGHHDGDHDHHRPLAGYSAIMNVILSKGSISLIKCIYSDFLDIGKFSSNWRDSLTSASIKVPNKIAIISSNICIKFLSVFFCWIFIKQKKQHDFVTNRNAWKKWQKIKFMIKRKSNAVAFVLARNRLDSCFFFKANIERWFRWTLLLWFITLGLIKMKIEFYWLMAS